MVRSEGDELVAACCLFPADGVRRQVLADWLTANGDEKLGAAAAAPGGEDLVRRTWAAADKLQVPPGVRVLYAVWVAPTVVTRERPEPPARTVRRDDESPWTRRRDRWPFGPDVRWSAASHPTRPGGP